MITLAHTAHVTGADETKCNQIVAENPNKMFKTRIKLGSFRNDLIDMENDIWTNRIRRK